MKLRILGFVMILLVGSGAANPPQQPNALATLAAAMSPGTWAELPTTGGREAFTMSQGNTGIITPYSSNIPYDPVTETVHFLGSDHGPPNPTIFRHVTFSLATSAFSVYTPDWYDYLMYNDSHGYERTSMNVAARQLIRTPGGDPIRLMNLDTKVWSTMAPPPEGSYGMYGSAYFTARNSLLYPTNGGTFWEHRFATGLWGQITSYDGLVGGQTWWQIIDNPVRNEALMIESASKMGVLSSAGVFTRLADIPAAYRTYDGSGLNGFWIVEPGGKYLLMTDPTNGTGRNIYEFNPDTQVYTLLPNQVPDKHLAGRTNWIASTIWKYGVTLWIWTDGGNLAETGAAGAYIYKHTSSGPPPPPDTTAPLVSITSPTNGATVTSPVTLSATASDNVAVAGVKFMDDGVLIGAEDTGAPYSVSWSPLVGTHVLTAIARDAAGNTKTSTAISVTAQAPPTGLTFAQKCAQAGVLGCYGFDSQSELRYAYSQNTNPCTTEPAVQPNTTFTNNRLAGEANATTAAWNGVCNYPAVDTAIKRSGAGSLKFNIPSQWPANTSGNFTSPIAGLGTSGFIGRPSDTNPKKIGTTLYWQFWQYFEPEFLTIRYAPLGGWKQLIVYGNPPNGSNSSGIEVTHVNGGLHGIPGMYGQQGADDYGYQDVRMCPYGTGNFTYPEPPCIRYKPGWMEFTVAVNMGEVSCYGQNPVRGDTRVRLWVDGQPAIDNPYACMTYNAGAGDGLGQFVITPFQTGKDETQVTPVARTYVDDLIFSTQPIPMTGGTPPPPPPPPPQDTTPPTVSMTHPTPGQVVSGTSMDVSASATDNVGVASVQFMLDGAALGALDTAAPYGLLWNTTQTTNGAHVLTALARDAAGNPATSAALSVTVNNGTVPPPPVNAAPVLQPVGNQTLQIPSDGSTTASKVVTAAATDDGIPGPLTYLWAGSGLTFGQPTQPATNVTAPAGNYAATVTVSDGVLQDTESFTVTVLPAPSPVNQAPKVWIKTPASGQVITSKTFTVAIEGTDDVGIVWMEIRINGTLVASGASSTLSYSLNTNPFKGRTFTVLAIAKDADGLSASSSLSASVQK